MLRRIGKALAGALLGIALLNGNGNAGTFPRPAAVENNVQFWVNVFTGYGERDFIIHDKDQVWRVYQVMHLPGEGAPGRSDIDAMNDYLKMKYAGILKRLATGAQPADYDERRVAELFKGEPLSAYTLAAENLRLQQGMRQRFAEGILRSRYYRPTMERIFRAAGLPAELVTLAEIESGFQSSAKSGAGAVGIWQFTRDTGKEYMRITRYHDDRLDPTTETHAAAQLLRSNYNALGNWPLAITAYNYGTGGMANAASQYNSDYEKIVRNYGGSRFGFASKNYYPEFLAALQVHEYEDKYFPELKYQETPTPPPVRTDFAPPHHAASVHRASTHRSHRTRSRRSAARTIRVRGQQSRLAESGGATPS